jgi:hypothetical protein
MRALILVTKKVQTECRGIEDVCVWVEDVIWTKLPKQITELPDLNVVAAPDLVAVLPGDTLLVFRKRYSGRLSRRHEHPLHNVFYPLRGLRVALFYVVERPGPGLVNYPALDVGLVGHELEARNFRR